MASNSRDETVKLKYETEGTAQVEALANAVGGVVEKSLGTETAFGFIKQHLEELTVAALALGTAMKAIQFGKESFNSVADVEASLSRVQALAAGSADQFARMDDAISEASKAVNVDGNVAASALANLASSGLDVQSAMSALVPTLQLAKIANIDVGTAANDVSVALKAFNLPASEAQHVVDLLTAASHGAAGGLTAISEATQKLAPDAKAIGLDFDQLAGILGYLTEHGISGRDALSGLRTVFQELQNPTSKLRGDLLSLGDGSADFNKAVQVLGSNTPQARDAVNGLAGSARTVVEALGGSGGALDAFTARLGTAGGEAQRVTGILDDNLNGAWNKFKLAFDDVGESLAKPVLKPFADELNKLAGDLRTFAASKDFKDIESEVATMAKNAAKALDDFLTHVDWKSFLEDGKDSIGKISDAFTHLAEVAETTATAIGKVIDGVGVAYHGAAVAIDGAVHVLAKGTDEFVSNLSLGKSKLTEFHNVLIDVADSAGEQFSKNIDATGASLESLAGTADDAAQSTNKLAQSSRDAVQPAEAHAAAAKDQANAADAAATASENLGAVLQPLPELHLQIADSTRSAGAGIRSFADDANIAYDAAEKATSGTDALKTAFATLKVSSQTELAQVALAATSAFAVIDKSLDQSVASMSDRRNAFLEMAKAQLAAVAGLDDGAQNATRYQLEAKAASLGLLDALEKLESTGKAAGDSLAKSGERIASSFAHATHQADQLDKSLAGAGDQADQLHESLAGAGGGMQDLSDDAKNAKQQIKDLAEGDGGYHDLVTALANTREGFLQVSEAAAKAFDASFLSAWNLAFDSTGANIGKTVTALNNAAVETNQKIADQRRILQEVVAQLNAIGPASNGSFGELGSDASDALLRLGLMNDQLKYGNSQFDLLGKQDLAGLQSALDAARQKVEAVAQATLDAKAKLGDMAKQLRDQLLQEQGDQAALEEERHKQKLDDLLAEAKLAGDINSADYQQAVQLEDQLHALKMQKIQDEQARQQSQAQSSTGTGSGGTHASSNNGSSTNGGSVSRSTSSAVGTAQVNHTVDINFNGTVPLSLTEPLINEIGYQVIQQLKRDAART